MDKNLIDWASVSGGVTGFISLIIVVIEKFTKRPKIRFEVLNVQARESMPSRTDSFYQYHLNFDLEIGNVGNEMTTAIKTELFIFELNSHFPCKYGGPNPLDKGETSLLLEPGFAGHFKIWHWIRVEERLKGNDLSGTLKIKLLGGKLLQKNIRFVLEKAIS